MLPLIILWMLLLLTCVRIESGYQHDWRIKRFWNVGTNASTFTRHRQDCEDSEMKNYSYYTESQRIVPAWTNRTINTSLYLANHVCWHQTENREYKWTNKADGRMDRQVNECTDKQNTRRHFKFKAMPTRWCCVDRWLGEQCGFGVELSGAFIYKASLPKVLQKERAPHPHVRIAQG